MSVEKMSRKLSGFVIYLTEGVIHLGFRPQWITPSSICLILHILRKANSLIPLLLIQNNSYYKNIANTCLPASMLSLSSIVYLQVCPAPQIFPNSRCRPPSCLLAVFCHIFTYYFAQFQLQFLLLKLVKCPPFFFSQPKQLNLVPGFPVNGTLTCSGLHFCSHFLVKHKILPNLVISSWLW